MSNDLIDRAMSRLPALLREQTAEWLSDFMELSDLPDTDLALQSLPLVWSCSPFVARSCLRDPGMLLELCASGDLESSSSEGAIAARLASWLEGVAEEDALNRQLRRFRRREMVRIAWRDLAGWVQLDETLRDLSTLAAVCIDGALQWLQPLLQARFGVPRTAEGREATFYVLGMGKFGGEELNYSSDIDLIFGFTEPGHTDGARPVANEQYFSRLGRRLINSLNAQTVDGFVFRVDMRLRPYGDSGPLVMFSDQLETYYESQGREWERYAMVKARAVGGDRQAGEALLASLKPFIYRRYLDYGALDSLRNMKAMIAREVERKGMEDNLKLGPGGIREVEFIGQVFQLIRGGREKQLQQRRIVPVLEYLGEHGALPGFAVRGLLEGYDFLRRSENRLQAIDDQQVHSLPEQAMDRQRLAFGMGFERWEEYCNALDGLRGHVHEHFEQVFNAPQAQGARVPTGSPEVGDVWALRDNEQAAVIFRENGFEEPEQACQRLRIFREGSHCRALTDNGRARLDRLMPLLLGAVCGVDNPDVTLIRLLDLLESIVRRTAYLALLVEHSMALSQLVKLCSASPWIARHLGRYPMLLDELLDPRTLYAPLKRAALATELRERLDEHPENDLEQQMEVLRQFKQANTLRVAAADVSGITPLMVVSDYLTDIAEVVLTQVMDLAWRHLAERHGRPTCMVDGQAVEPGFGIIAYGKLGGLELGYGSDLDLVFIHNSRGDKQITNGERSVDNTLFFVRVAQRVIHILGATMAGGVLYDVDTRLRPSGRAGLLATSLQAYAEYQREKAWTWEHQALVRARFVVGDPEIARSFGEVRREILLRPRDSDILRTEVREMRERMRDNKGSRKPGQFDLKQDRGGIADIEFIVQYGVLSGARKVPTLLRYTDNIRLLGELSESGWISRDQAELLIHAYRAYRARLHRATLQETAAIVSASEFNALREAVAALWLRLMVHDQLA